MDIKQAMREQLIEGYKPKEVSGCGCALCQRSAGSMSLHLLEATIPENSPLPPDFIPMSRSRGVIRGSFGVCTECAPVCSKCGIAIQSKKVRQGYEALRASAWPGAGVYAGNGYCQQHTHFLRLITDKGLAPSFESPFARVQLSHDHTETEEGGMSTGTARLLQMRKRRGDAKSEGR